MSENELLEKINGPAAAGLFTSLYGADELGPARLRYSRLAEELRQSVTGKSLTGAPFRAFSVPGRTELGGNHTDHNQGKVLAASIHLDAAAIAVPTPGTEVFFRSTGHRDVTVDISDLSARDEEKGNTESLIRGIAAEFAARGTPVSGFAANANNRVFTGSGLSSSAAVEVLIAKIFDSLFCGGRRSALELAQIGQKAENLYFGKPCGLMDQAACASGGAIAIDFGDPENPIIRRLNFDTAGFSLCVINTGGNHANLTPDYAAVPAEMKAAAAFFGKNVLREVNEEDIRLQLPGLRKSAGDRAALRALHFFNENRRVDEMAMLLENPPEPSGAFMEKFLALVRESGDSSWEILQNVYSPGNPSEQGVSLALAITKDFLNAERNNGTRRGGCRVHGGGFAGTIQAYVPGERLNDYRNLMEGIFGAGSLTVLRIRPQGAVEINADIPQ